MKESKILNEYKINEQDGPKEHELTPQKEGGLQVQVGSVEKEIKLSPS